MLILAIDEEYIADNGQLTPEPYGLAFVHCNHAMSSGVACIY